MSFPIPPSWAGNIPVSGNPGEDRQLYFWMFPATGDIGHDDVVIWLNGGPGCSSLSATLEENGPVMLDPITYEAKANPDTWTQYANIIWIDQPAGVGFSLGTPKNQTMEEVAQEFNGFLLQLYAKFAKLQGKRLWITGESFAGKYIPHMANWIYNNEEENTKAGILLQGVNVDDPLFAPNVVTKELPSVDYGLAYQKELNLTSDEVHELEQIGEQNGIRHFVRDHLTYPPKGPISIPPNLNTTFSPYDHLKQMIMSHNPCFSPYYTVNKSPCGTLDALGANMTTQATFPLGYFHHPPVVAAINAQPNISWVQCSQHPNFKIMKTANTNYPVPDVFGKVIEKSKKTIVQHGTHDYVVLFNGSALAIQNMTWHGKQGFQHPPSKTLSVDGEKKGYYQTERNLTFVVIKGAGHMVPAYAPKAASQLLRFLLGQIEEDDINT